MNLMGRRIKEMRTKRGYTQDTLADELGMNRANISNYERGQITNIPSDKLDLMANLFGVTVDYLMGRTDDPQESKSSSEIPSWATTKDIRDFKELLEDEEPIMFDGVPISSEDKEKIKRVMEAMFWDAKAKNKDTYGRKKKDD